MKIDSANTHSNGASNTFVTGRPIQQSTCLVSPGNCDTSSRNSRTKSKRQSRIQWTIRISSIAPRHIDTFSETASSQRTTVLAQKDPTVLWWSQGTRRGPKMHRLQSRVRSGVRLRRTRQNGSKPSDNQRSARNPSRWMHGRWRRSKLFPIFNS